MTDTSLVISEQERWKETWVVLTQALRNLGLKRQTREGEMLVSFREIVIGQSVWAFVVDTRRLPVPIESLRQPLDTLSAAVRAPVTYVENNRYGFAYLVKFRESIGHDKLPTNVAFDLSLLPDRMRHNYPMFLGVGDTGSIYLSLDQAVHVLVAGTTGAGKSALISSMLAALTLTMSPDDLKLALIDGKVVDMAFWQSVPHLAYPFATDLQAATYTMQQLSAEVERRLGLFQATANRNINGYNRMFPAIGQRLPRVVCVIDELAFFMQERAKDRAEFYGLLVRMAGRARATGVHLIVGTNEPSSEVIPGLKPNLGLKISGPFDPGPSQAIFGNGIAARLPKIPGRMVSMLGESTPTVFQAPFIDDEQTRSIVEQVKQQWGQGGVIQRALPIDRIPCSLDQLKPAERLLVERLGPDAPVSVELAERLLSDAKLSRDNDIQPALRRFRAYGWITDARGNQRGRVTSKMYSDLGLVLDRVRPTS